MLTTWGYSITSEDILPDLLSEDEFDALTGSKYAGDNRTEYLIKSASAAIRGLVGWHLAPSETCEAVFSMQSGNVRRVGPDLLVQLPARFVSSVGAVLLNARQENGEWYGVPGDYDFDTNGILRVYNAGICSRRSKVVIRYIAGLTDDMLGAVKEMISYNVQHSMANGYGVQSETAGGVSISYSANWANSGRATALADDSREVLAPYRLQGVF